MNSSSLLTERLHYSIIINNTVTMSTMTDTVAYPDTTSATFIIRLYALPVICCVGLVGNTMAAFTFLTKQLRHTSCSLYLAVRSISDNGFILTLLFAWLDFVKIHLYHTNGLCQILPFLSYVCSFISVWCVVFVTGENYVRICHPMKVSRLCSIQIAKILTILSVIASLVLYNFPLWGVKVQSLGSTSQCLTIQTPFMQSAELIVTYLDTAFTLLIPLIVIIIFMSCILCSATQASRRHLRRQTNYISNNNNNNSSGRVLPHTKVTRLLSSVSVIFLIFHTPLHAIRLKVLLFSQIYNAPPTDLDRRFQHIFVTMFYLNFSINCFIYLLVGKNFRKIFAQTFCFCSLRCPRCSIDEECNEERFSSGMATSTLMLDREEETAT